MLFGRELTPRQAARVLAQALRTQTELVIERQHGPGDPLSGRLESVSEHQLGILLAAGAGPVSGEWIGAFCTGRLVLSGYLYLFASCVLDVEDAAPGTRLVLQAPESIQLANRRRFERYRLQECCALSIWGTPDDSAWLGLLFDVSPVGVSCLLTGPDCDNTLLLGDHVRTSFCLPGTTRTFELAAEVCNKTRLSAGHQMLIGLEFLPPGDPAQQEAIEQLRAVLASLLVAPATGEQP